MDFKGKIGPLPVWTWGLIIGGFFVVWMWVANRNSPVDVEATTEAPSQDADYGGSVVEGSYGSDFSTVPVVTPGQTEAVTGSETNADWLRKAIAAVVDQGTVSTLSAQTALQKYLAGQSLSAAEASIVNAATAKVGIPPEGVDTPDAAEPVTPDTSVGFGTKTTLSAPTTMKSGTTYPITATVAWADPQNHTMTPKGWVYFIVDGKKVRRAYAINGKATSILRPSKGTPQGKDGLYQVRASFEPTGRTQASSSNTVNIRIK